MPDCSILDVTCQVGQTAENIAQDSFTRVAQYVGQGAADLLATSLTWWIDTPSVDPNSAAVQLAQTYTRPLVLLILTASVVWQGIQMILSRRKDPAINIGLGLVRFVAVSALGLVLIGGALAAADELSGVMVAQSMQNFSNNMRELLGIGVITNPFTLLLLGFLGFLLGVIQWILMFFRQAGLLVLCGLLPLAASGSINDSTKPWLGRVIPWIIGLIAYKPIAALIYAIGFTFLGNARDISTALTGLVIIVLAVVAMPVLMRFFSFTGLALGGGGSPASVLAGAVAMGATASMVAGSSGSGAVGQSNFVSSTGPGSQPGGGSAQPAALPAGSGGGGGGSLPGGGPSGGGPPTGGAAGGGTGGGGGGPTGGEGGSGPSGGQGPAGPQGAGAAGGSPGAGASAPGASGAATAGGGAGAGAGAAAGGAAAAAGPAGAAAMAAGQAAQKAAEAPDRIGGEMTGGAEQ